MTQIHFISGLPRSGSTLLCNILNQNPKFHVTPTDGVIEIILSIRNQFENVTAFKAAPNPEGKEAIMKAILPAYTSIYGKEVVFLKNRAWPPYIEMLEFLLDRNVKILCTVRTIVDILASFEKLYRKNIYHWQFPQEKSNHNKWQTVEDRAQLWMSSDQPVGSSYNKVRDVFNRNLEDRLHFVEFDKLTKDPEVAMVRIYNFLDEPFFQHDFNNVKQTTFENDLEHGIPGLHDIRSKVEPFEANSLEILGEDTYKKFSNAEFWR